MAITIDILLASYNGESYVREQINSLYNQDFLEWKMRVRDDLSSDNTITIIREEQDRVGKDKIVILPSLARLGVSQNFDSLLQAATSKYILFCDQDDVWLPDKITISLQKIKEMEKKYGADTPILIHTDLTVVDQNLNLLCTSFWKYQNLDPDTSSVLSRLLVQNVVTGCTMMINQPLKNIIGRIPPEAIMHDWWIALVASVFGRIDYVPSSTVLYRQHSRNDTGARRWDLRYLVQKAINLDSVKDYYQKTVRQTRKFIEVYEDKIPIEKHSILENYAHMDRKNFWERRWNLLKFGYYKIGSLKNLGLFFVV
jgi:glycosyltransferase involved in cell wall biosynthesis